MKFQIFVIFILCFSLVFADAVNTEVTANPGGPVPPPLTPTGSVGEYIAPETTTYEVETVPVDQEIIEIDENKFFSFTYPNAQYNFDFDFEFEEQPEFDFNGPLSDYVIYDSIEINEEGLTFMLELPETFTETSHLEVTAFTETQETVPMKIYVKPISSKDVFVDFQMQHNQEKTYVKFKVRNLNENEKLKVKVTFPKQISKEDFEFYAEPDEFYFGSTVIIWDLDLLQYYQSDLSFDISDSDFDLFLGANIEYEYEQEKFISLFFMPNFYLVVCSALMFFFVISVNKIKSTDDYLLKELEWREKRIKAKLEQVKNSRHNPERKSWQD